MDKVSAYVVANAQGSYDFITKSSQNNTPFVIPGLNEDVPKTSNAQNKSKNYDVTDYDPFEDLKNTGSVKLPDWMDTKREPTRSDEEILKDVEELAKEYAKAWKKMDYTDERYIALMKEYVSVASPDRAGILSKAMPEINGIVNAIYGADSQNIASDIYRQLDAMKASEEKEKEEKKKSDLLSFLMDVLKNNGGYKHVSIDITIFEFEKNTTIQCDMYQCWVKNGSVDRVEFFDPNYGPKTEEDKFGWSIMSYQDGKMSQALLAPELIRKRELCATFDAAYDFACNGFRQPQPPKGNVKIASEDYLGQVEEAYNKTYIDTFARLKREARSNVA